MMESKSPHIQRWRIVEVSYGGTGDYGYDVMGYSSRGEEIYIETDTYEGAEQVVRVLNKYAVC